MTKIIRIHKTINRSSVYSGEYTITVEDRGDGDHWRPCTVVMACTAGGNHGNGPYTGGFIYQDPIVFNFEGQWEWGAITTLLEAIARDLRTIERMQTDVSP